MKRLFLLLLLSSPVGAVEYTAWVGGDTITNSSQDTALVGFNIEWEHIVLEFGHGRKRVGWSVPAEDWEANEWQSGSLFAVRYYPFRYKNVRPMLIWTHVSDILRGKPFNNKDEPTADYYGAGLTFDLERVEIDVAYGRFNRECALFDCAIGAASNEALIRFRFNFWSNK